MIRSGGVVVRVIEYRPELLLLMTGSESPRYLQQ
jgi:hypothetical protein